MFPTINKKETGVNLRRIMDMRGVKPKDIQEYLGFGCVQSVYRWLDGVRLEVAICDFKNGLEDSMAKDNSELIDVNSDVKDRVMEVSHIQSLIYVIRGKQVMLDSDLAILY